MKRYLQHTATLMLLGLIAFFTMPAQGQDDTYGTTGADPAVVPRVDPGVMVIDGFANEEVWQSAALFNVVQFWDEYDRSADVQVIGRALYSTDTLYVHVFYDDYQELYFVPGAGYSGEQIYIGVDGTHAGDTTVGGFGGFWYNAPTDEVGPATYMVTHPDQGGITLQYGGPGVFPADSGWVNGKVLIDEENFDWQVEVAIWLPQVEEGAEIGFNLGGSAAGPDYAEYSDGEPGGDGNYGYFSWQVGTEPCHPENPPEAASYCTLPGGTVIADGAGFATLVMGNPVAIEEIPGSGIPDAFALHSNYPNPFAQSTTIAYDIAEPAHVTLSVFDVLGREVTTLVDDKRAANMYKVRWTPESHLSSGIYFYQLRVDDQLVATRRVTLLR